MTRCEMCSTELERREVFCPSCHGRMLPLTEVKICPGCQRQHPREDTSCDCGRDMRTVPTAGMREIGRGEPPPHPVWRRDPVQGFVFAGVIGMAGWMVADYGRPEDIWHVALLIPLAWLGRAELGRVATIALASLLYTPFVWIAAAMVGLVVMMAADLMTLGVHPAWAQTAATAAIGIVIVVGVTVINRDIISHGSRRCFALKVADWFGWAGVVCLLPLSTFTLFDWF